MTGRFPSRVCPLCEGAEKELLFRQTFHPDVHGGLMAGYDVVTCRACGFGFADGVPPQEDLDAYYARLANYGNALRDGAESAEDAGRFRAIAELLASHLPSADARVLEVGCSTGALLGVLRTMGFPNVEGLDPSPECARVAEKRHAVTVLTGTLFEAARSPREADMVVLVGVLEHIVDVGRAARRLRELCAPGGSVFVEVPDATRFASCVDAPFQQFSTEHVGYFSRGTLAQLMGRHGFTATSCRRTVRAHTANSRMPVIAATFGKGRGEGEPLRRDLSISRGLRAYIARSRDIEARIRAAVDGLVESREPILVWGLGTFTRRLLVTTPLLRANIRAFVDSNPSLWGRTVAGLPVLSPEDVRTRAEAILVSSLVFADEIRHQIRSVLGCPNPVLDLLA